MAVAGLESLVDTGRDLTGRGLPGAITQGAEEVIKVSLARTRGGATKSKSEVSAEKKDTHGMV